MFPPPPFSLPSLSVTVNCEVSSHPTSPTCLHILLDFSCPSSVQDASLGRLLSKCAESSHCGGVWYWPYPFLFHCRSTALFFSEKLYIGFLFTLDVLKFAHNMSRGAILLIEPVHHSLTLGLSLALISQHSWVLLIETFAFWFMYFSFYTLLWCWHSISGFHVSYFFLLHLLSFCFPVPSGGPSQPEPSIWLFPLQLFSYTIYSTYCVISTVVSFHSQYFPLSTWPGRPVPASCGRCPFLSLRGHLWCVVWVLDLVHSFWVICIVGSACLSLCGHAHRSGYFAFEPIFPRGYQRLWPSVYCSCWV